MDDDLTEITNRAELEPLCETAGRPGLPQLPLFKGRRRWGARAVPHREPVHGVAGQNDRAHREPAVCFLIGGDLGFGFPDPSPSEWVSAKRRKYWCQNGGAIVHGSFIRPADRTLSRVGGYNSLTAVLPPRERISLSKLLAAIRSDDAADIGDAQP